MGTTPQNSSDTFKITGNWATQAKGLKTKYHQLSDSDLKFEPGKENELITRLQNRLNKTREEVIGIIRVNQQVSSQ